ncbi:MULTISPECIES: formimidoylglutamate deiminase [Halomonadaceae]|uniref:formimidoylglutamate deiminase n=1 Tax=Halomonadaceae TaxID=28256 RepID=UPI00159919A0|nr:MULTISPECIES: formimidoylglutamate deiminase [Halomonas]QJQ93873.1 formimidoylglutamate deiminase [Halomonas sp. PA5]
MQRYFADHALLPSGWAKRVLLEVDTAGTLVSVTPERAPGSAERLRGPALPGMPNLHSHAFQRAMAGLAEVGSERPDSFWSWRERMYALVDRLTPGQVATVAQALYVEMLKGGYTQVSEFHYLHHDPQGRPYADPAEMAWAISGAAERSGIGLTLLPVLYAHGGFGGQPPSAGQRRFVHDVESFLRLLEGLAPALAARPTQALGMAFHSLRAVTLDEMRAVLEANPVGPRHIHVAEQAREVEESLAYSGQRPVRWLLDNIAVDERWCLIHATHLDDSELRDLAASGAVAGLCPTTEANLGDGLFRAVEYAAQGGRLGIGSDSHVSLDVVEELRLLEYGQRLATRRRNCLHDSEIRPVGDWLYRCALAGGAQASGQPIGALAPGMRADLVVLDGDDPYLATADDASRLGRWLFGGTQRQIRDVMVAGRWVIEERRHALDDENRAALGTLFTGLG